MDSRFLRVRIDSALTISVIMQSCWRRARYLRHFDFRRDNVTKWAECRHSEARARCAEMHMVPRASAHSGKITGNLDKRASDRHKVLSVMKSFIRAAVFHHRNPLDATREGYLSGGRARRTENGKFIVEWSGPKSTTSTTRNLRNPCRALPPSLPP